MKMGKADESSLLIALTEGIQSCTVTWYGYAQLTNDFDVNVKTLLDPEFSKKLNDNLDEGGLESFIQREVFKIFYEEGIELPPKDATKKLISYKPFSDPLQFAKHLLSCIKSSPYQYEVVMRACNALQEHFGDKSDAIAISDRMNLAHGSKIKERFVTGTGNDKLDAIYTSYNVRDQSVCEIDDDALYFVYRTSGIVSDRTKPRPFFDFYDDLRAFYGASVSFDILLPYPAQKHRSSVAMIANLLDGEHREFRHCEVADTDLTNCVAFMTTKETDQLLEQGVTLGQILEPVFRLFNSEENQRLKTAAIWLLRGHRTSRGMDQILDSTIAIEVLLGDREASDRVGLSKLMANRCAYALGRSASERKDLFDFFMRFYKVRSDIVHSGRMRLSESEAEVVDKGIKLASRILRHETDIG